MFKNKLNTSADSLNLPLNNIAIVTLGYALAKNGTIQPTLIERLKKTLEAANIYRESIIIVSGGASHQGVCESYLMKKWLIEKGINHNRIIVEDRSIDTVGNALYSTKILQNNEDIKNVILITSASHIRRAISVFKKVSKKKSHDIKYTNLVYMDYENKKTELKIYINEILATFRDVFKVSAIMDINRDSKTT